MVLLAISVSQKAFSSTATHLEVVLFSKDSEVARVSNSETVDMLLKAIGHLKDSGEISPEILKYYPESYQDKTLDGKICVYRLNYSDSDASSSEQISNKSVLTQEWNIKSGRLEGKSIESVDSDKDRIIWNYREGKLDGMTETADSLKTYQNGKLNGPYKTFDSPSKKVLLSEVNYVDDKKQGVEKKYYKSGNEESEIYYVDGNENGTYKAYYESGQLRDEGSYKDGKPTGSSRSYYENGNPKQEVVFKNGEPYRKSTYYTNGEKIVEIFDKGELISRTNYNSDGVRQDTDYYRNNKSANKVLDATSRSKKARPINPNAQAIRKGKN